MLNVIRVYQGTKEEPALSGLVGRDGVHRTTWLLPGYPMCISFDIHYLTNIPTRLETGKERAVCWVRAKGKGQRAKKKKNGLCSILGMEPHFGEQSRSRRRVCVHIYIFMYVYATEIGAMSVMGARVVIVHQV